MSSGSSDTILVCVPQITHPDYPGLERLREAGFRVELNGTGRVLGGAELAARLADAVATIGHGEIYDEAALACAPKLRCIARFGVGWDKIDVAAATRRRIPIAMAFGANEDSVAEFTLGLILALRLGLLPRHGAVRSGAWPIDVRPGLAGARLGLVGFGRIGRAVAARAKPFGCRIAAADPAADARAARALDVELEPLAYLLAKADIVSVHVPLSAGTRGLIGHAEIAAMKPGAVLINTARGGIVDEAALAEALHAGRLAAAALDVFASEPLALDSPLRTAPHVILTPHAAANDSSGHARMLARCIDNLLAILVEKRLPRDFVVNPEVWRDAR